MKKSVKQVSKNKHAEQVVGLRIEKGEPVDQPCEINFHCPICEYEQVTDGEFDERLEWGEYNGFLWCSVCNKDYPATLCVPREYIDRAIEVYLNCVNQAVKRDKYCDCGKELSTGQCPVCDRDE